MSVRYGNVQFARDIVIYVRWNCRSTATQFAADHMIQSRVHLPIIATNG